MTKKKIIRFFIAFIVLIIGIYLVWSSGLIQNLINKKTISGKPDFSQYYKGDYKEAFNKLLPAAEQGDVVAQVSLGNLYSNGLGIKKNYEKAYYWYNKAADKGSTDAMINLAVMYKNGNYVTKDIDKAIDLYKKAIRENNDSTAIFDLAMIYLKIKNDNKNGIDLLIKSSNQNNSLAQSQLGVFYYFGLYGLKTNYKKSFDILKKSSDLGNPVGQNNLALLYHEGKAVKKDDFRAFFWFYIASKYGNSPKSKELINTYKFDLTDAQKQQAVNDAKEWVKNNKEQNFDLISMN